MLGEALVQEALLFLGELEAAHDPQEGAPAVEPVDERVVGVDLGLRHRPAVAEALLAKEGGEHGLRGGAEPERAEPGDRERAHRPGAAKAGRAEQGVERGQRLDPLGVADRPLAADRPADVVDDEVTALDLERLQRLAEPAGEARPGVVELGRAIGEAEAGEVERHRAQPLVGERRHHLAVQKRARRHPVQEHDDGPRPCSRTKLRTPPAVNRRPAALWIPITCATSAFTGG